MSALKIASLHIYPVKSCKGIELAHAEITRTGLKYDRQWMVVSEANGKFITQRTDPKLSLVRTALPEEALTPEGPSKLPSDAALILSAPSIEPLTVLLNPPVQSANAMRECSVWEWTGLGQDEGDHAARWFSDVLGKPCRLVRYVGGKAAASLSTASNVPPPEESGATAVRRPTDPEYAPGYETAFADGYPILLASQSSLAKVEQASAQSLNMNRFRPNIVVTGGADFEEDLWMRMEMGQAFGGGPIEVTSVKPCSRCTVPNVNQETAEGGKQPFSALREIRSGKVLGWDKRAWQNQVFFGWNVVTEQDGVIKVGDDVRVVQQRAA